MLLVLEIAGGIVLGTAASIAMTVGLVVSPLYGKFAKKLVNVFENL